MFWFKSSTTYMSTTNLMFLLSTLKYSILVSKLTFWTHSLELIFCIIKGFKISDFILWWSSHQQDLLYKKMFHFQHWILLNSFCWDKLDLGLTISYLPDLQLQEFCGYCQHEAGSGSGACSQKMLQGIEDGTSPTVIHHWPSKQYVHVRSYST